MYMHSVRAGATFVQACLSLAMQPLTACSLLVPPSFHSAWYPSTWLPHLMHSPGNPWIKSRLKNDQNLLGICSGTPQSAAADNQRPQPISQRCSEQAGRKQEDPGDTQFTSMCSQYFK